MDLNTTIETATSGFQMIGGFISGVESFSGTLQVLLIVLGAIDIIATFLLPQVVVSKIPKLIRIINYLPPYGNVLLYILSSPLMSLLLIRWTVNQTIPIA